MGLREQLQALGLGPGDTVMVHASMRAVGGRAEAVLDALIPLVDHVLMLVCGPEPFDPDGPAWEDLGVLSEVFRQRPEVVLNTHPIARFGSTDPALVRDPPHDDYYGPGSPLERLVQAGGKVLRLGADGDTVTLFHHAEYRAQLATKARVERAWEHVDGSEGVITCLDDDDGIAPWHRDYFFDLLEAALALPSTRIGPVGGCTAEVLDAQDAVACAVRWIEENLG